MRSATHIDRRTLLRLACTGALGWIATRAMACVGEAAPTTLSDDEAPTPESTESALEAGSSPTVDASSPADATDADADADADAHEASGAFVILYDTFAQAMYFDGTYGPHTGIIRVADVATGADKVYDFWHGHSGQIHRFTLTSAHFALLKQKKRATLKTTVVDGHQHELFVDPVGPMWRVPGAQPVQVPLP